MARFDNKVVLVSGGARGQGAAEARLLVAQGAKVVIGDVLDNQGQALAVELGPAASFVRHDVTSEADWARASIEYVIPAQWRVAATVTRPPIPPTIPMSQGVQPPRPSSGHLRASR